MTNSSSSVNRLIPWGPKVVHFLFSSGSCSSSAEKNFKRMDWSFR